MEGFDLRDLLNPEHWLAMDSVGDWYLYEKKPLQGGFSWTKRRGTFIFRMLPRFFNLPPCENWEDSLIQVKDLIKD